MRFVGVGEIPELSKEDIARVMDRPQNVAILKFLSDKDWVTAEDISKKMGINVTLIMLYLSDLEKVGLIVRQLDEGGDKKTFQFKAAKTDGNYLEEMLEAKGGDLSQEKVTEAVGLYIDMYASLINKLNEVGGKATIENIVEGGVGNVDDNLARVIVSHLEKGGTGESALENFKKDLSDGGLKSGGFIEIKGDFIEILKKMIEALEKFMGRLYGQHLTKSSLKPVINKRIDLIQELDLLAGLPKEYFPVGGK